MISSESIQVRLAIKNCGQCQYAFEHLHGYNCYVCDIDAHPIQLHRISDLCPILKIETPICIVCMDCCDYVWNFSVEPSIRICRGCGSPEVITEQEAA